MAENITFVTIDLNRKQVNTDNPVHNDKTGKDYARVFAPGVRRQRHAVRAREPAATHWPLHRRERR